MITFIEDTHQYFNEEGKELISVTTLMRKHGLAPDYSGVSKEVLAAKAERGTLIHKELEDFIKEGELGFTEEVYQFRQWLETTASYMPVKVLQSEFIVGNDVAAGQVDLLLSFGGTLVIADFKTTSTLHKDAVAWQLSIYAYLSGADIQEGKVFHFTKDGLLKVIDIPLKPMDQVKRLMEAERNGELFTYELSNAEAVEEQLQQLAVLENVITIYEKHRKEAEDKAKELRQALLIAMEENGVKTFENERIRLTYIEPSTRTTIDSTRLKKEKPEIAEEYSKTTTTKASLRITLKGVNENE